MEYDSPKKKMLLKTLSKELLDYKKPIPIQKDDSNNNQILNVQVSKFNESYHFKNNIQSFENEEKYNNEDFLNSFSFGRVHLI